jgi:hypothetical protein
MSITWTTLEKELAINGVELVDNKMCRVLEGEVLRPRSIVMQIRQVDRDIIKNRTALEDNLSELLKLLMSSEKAEENQAIDPKTVSLFIHSMKAMIFSFNTYLEGYRFRYKNTGLEISSVYDAVRSCMNTDYMKFPKNVILDVPDYKLSMDWLVRNLNKLSYLKRLLLMAMKGKDRIDKYFVKIARGVQGPWANLDLPMLERVFEWKDIEEEVRGRDRDIRKQRRYQMGFDHYNDYSKKSGEGFYWVEMNNEPYLWTERGDNSPYSGRSSLSNWG